MLLFRLCFIPLIAYNMHVAYTDNTTSNNFYFSSDSLSTSDFFTTLESPPKTGGKGAKGVNINPYTDIEIKETLTISTFCLITLVILSNLLSLKSSKCQNKFTRSLKAKSGKFLFVSYIAALISFYINSILLLFALLNMDELYPSDTWQYLMVFTRVPYQFGRLLMQIFFVLRLYYIFEKTAMYAIPHKVLKLLIFLSIIEFLCGCIASIFGPLHLWNDLGVDPEHTPSRYFANVSTLIGAFVTIVTAYLFIINIYKLNVNVIEMDTANIKLTFIDLISRTTLLALISLLTTCGVIIKSLVEWIWDSPADRVLYRTVLTFDGAINIICMYLVFIWSTYQYHLCCNICDRGIKKCCIVSTKQSVKKKEKKQNKKAQIELETVGSSSPISVCTVGSSTPNSV